MAKKLEGALAALKAGGVVIVADADDREGEGDLVMSARAVTPNDMAFLVRHGSGIVCVPMTAERADQLRLAPMVSDNTDPHRTAFTVSVDHVATGTGISAADRAQTIRALADPRTTPEDLRRPGHVFPLVARAGGVARRPGHTEAALDLLAMAEVGDVAVITELVSPDGVPMHGAVLTNFARGHGIPFITIDDILGSPAFARRLVTRTGRAEMPLDLARFDVTSYASYDGLDHLALTLGDVRCDDPADDGVLVRVHSECLTGDVFGSQRCDCGSQLRRALEHIVEEGRGAVVYVRGHEGRGIGLTQKIRAYALQEDGLDTVAANLRLGEPVDGREYRVAAGILADLGALRVRLMTNSPHKRSELATCGIDIAGLLPMPTFVTPDNARYLRAKRDLLGHDLAVPPVWHTETYVPVHEHSSAAVAT